jgi:hypothetical protein
MSPIQPSRRVLVCEHVECVGREVCAFSALDAERRGATLPVARTLAECCEASTMCAYVATTRVAVAGIAGTVRACDACAGLARLSLAVAR